MVVMKTFSQTNSSNFALLNSARCCTRTFCDTDWTVKTVCYTDRNYDILMMPTTCELAIVDHKRTHEACYAGTYQREPSGFATTQEFGFDKEDGANIHRDLHSSADKSGEEQIGR
jgi:hypothetical protein